jgi:hypothetical protein
VGSAASMLATDLCDNELHKKLLRLGAPRSLSDISWLHQHEFEVMR